MTQLYYKSKRIDPFDILYKAINDPFFTSLRSEKASSLVKYPYNVIDCHDAIRIEIAVLGLDRADIDIKVQDDTLTVSTEKYQKDKDESYGTDEKYLIHKIVQRDFCLSWKLTDSILDLEQIGAKLEKGILRIYIPVKEEEKPIVKDIQID